MTGIAETSYALVEKLRPINPAMYIARRHCEADLQFRLPELERAVRSK